MALFPWRLLDSWRSREEAQHLLPAARQKLVKVDDGCKLPVSQEKHMGAEVAAESLGRVKGWVVQTSGGSDKPGFPIESLDLWQSALAVE